MIENKFFHEQIESDKEDLPEMSASREKIITRLETMLALDNKISNQILSRLLIKIPEKEIALGGMNEMFTDISLNAEKINGTYFIHTVYRNDGDLIDDKTFFNTINRLIDLFGKYAIAALDTFKIAE